MNDINHIVFSHTMYNNGKNRFYLPVDKLVFMIKEIQKTHMTNQYLRINPFYRNYCIDGQYEFDEYLFYLECQEFASEVAYRSHISSCFGKPYTNLTHDELDHAAIFYPLCEIGDYNSYNKSLHNYVNHLELLLPKLFEIVKSRGIVTEPMIPFGYFCFEVHAR